MKPNSAFVLLLTLLVALPISGAGQETQHALNQLGWLAGCWELTVADKQLVVNEQWMRPSGGMSIGSSRTVRAGKTVAFEFLRLTEEADGIYYIAKPSSNRDETRFKLTKITAAEAVFENPAHDFPQRIIYRRNGDKLDARIEGTINGKPRGSDFPYVRVKCE